MVLQNKNKTKTTTATTTEIKSMLLVGRKDLFFLGGGVAGVLVALL